MTAGQQPQHLAMILERDRPEVPVAQRDDRGGASVVRVGLALAARVQESRSRRQRRRNINHILTRRDELLGQQRSDSGRALNRPQPRCEWRGPFQ
jgi:hypothetical protein